MIRLNVNAKEFTPTVLKQNVHIETYKNQKNLFIMNLTKTIETNKKQLILLTSELTNLEDKIKKYVLRCNEKIQKTTKIIILPTQIVQYQKDLSDLIYIYKLQNITYETTLHHIQKNNSSNIDFAQLSIDMENEIQTYYNMRIHIKYIYDLIDL